MNLQSCDGCGVVIDIDKSEYPSKVLAYKDDGSLDLDIVGYKDDGYVLKQLCPVCGEDILSDEVVA